MTGTVEKIERIEPPAVMPLTPIDMVNKAVTSGASIEVLEKLMALHERYEASQARKDFDNAMSEAKAEIPVIAKNRTVDFNTSKGRTTYKHEDLAEIARTVSPILARHGLSYRFRATSTVNEPVTVTCVVSHRSGHFEEITLSAGRDDSGSKNSIQAVGSTLTYLQRMTLKAALGLAASDDDDGKVSEGAPDLISQEQADNLRDLIEANGKDPAKFLKWAKVEKIEDIAASLYESCVAAVTPRKAPKND